MKLNKSELVEWHQTKRGLLIFGLMELVLGYLFASLAIDSGNLLEWLLAIALAIGFVQNFVKLIWKFIHGNKTAKA